MKNPYTILDISQDADKAEIMKSQMLAMKKKVSITGNCCCSKTIT